MSDTDDVVVRARAALEGVLEGPWQWTSGTVWREDVIAVPDPSDPTGQTPMPERVQEKVCATSPDTAGFIAEARSLVPDLVAEVEQLRARLAAMPSAIRAYVHAELELTSYQHDHPDLTEEMVVVLAAQREALLRVQRNAEGIVAYASTAGVNP